MTLFFVTLASPAGAALLTLMGSTLTVAVGGLPPVAFSQNVTAVPVLVSSGAGGFTEPAGIFTGSVMLPTGLFTAVPIINGFTIAGMSNATKQIAPGVSTGVGNPFFGVHRAGGGLGGPGRLSGQAIVNVLALFNLNVPLFVVGYTEDYVTSSGSSPPTLVIGTGWTTGDVTITGLSTQTPSGAATNTVTFGALGFDHRTADHRGVVQLVSPFKVVTNAVGNLGGYALQTLTFTGVPEPGTLALLGAGVVALVGYGLRRRRAGP